MPCDLQTVDHERSRVRRGHLAKAGEPAPAAAGELHVSQPLNVRPSHARNFRWVEDRVVLVSLPARGALACVADFLGVQVRVGRAKRLQIKAEVDQDLLCDRG